MKYLERGVSSSKEDVHMATKYLDRGLFSNAFCKILPDYLGGDPDYCNIMHADGAGTKSSLAYIYWKETGDMSVWQGIAQDSVVMNLDDMLCAGVSNNMLVSSTIGRNKKRIPGEVIAAIINGTESFLQRMRDLGINMVFAGGETADVGDLVQTIIVDSTITARLRRNQVVTNENIEPGDVIVGLSSFGKTSYENDYNTGISSNGLTLARHDVLSKYYAEKYPESFDNDLPGEVVYTGKSMITDTRPELYMDVGKALLSPTRTYAPVVKNILQQLKQHVKALIHCTGGGQTKVLNFLKCHHVVKDQLFKVPPLFMFIQQQSGTPWREMYQVFNMGHRLEVYVNIKNADDVIAICKEFDLDAKVVGHVVASEKKQLTITGEQGTHIFS